MEVWILRGLPGSGKSTWIREFANKAPDGFEIKIFSTDDYFLNKDGIYEFNPRLLSQYHNDNFRSFLNHCLSDKHEYNVLVVDNTNLRALEIAPYYAVAKLFAEHVVIRDFVFKESPDYQYLYRRQIHDIPSLIWYNMVNTYCNEKLPSYWNVEKHFIQL